LFQWGWGSSLLGISEKIPIESCVPMMMFAIVFGLSMDCEVFLLGRYNWWIPAWLDRALPHLEPEGPPATLNARVTSPGGGAQELHPVRDAGGG
jgi:putative drug exporter of the RND superfamily